MIPYGRQEVTAEDIEAVVETLRSDFLTQGPIIPQFEQALARYGEASHCVALNNATSALHVACRALDLGPGDWLWTSPISFLASANCALYCGAQVDFVDIDPRTYNMCPDALERKLLMAEQSGCLPKIVVPVHLAGQAPDMAAISALAQKYGFKIIEDASHAIGGRYLSQPIGNCRFSDITVFSFHPVKIITTGEGGAALTNDAALADKMSLLRSHGMTRDPEKMTHASDGPWYYQQIDLGYNYRMTDIQASLGLSQLHRIDHYVARRHQLADRYNRLLRDLPVILPYQSEASFSAFHLYIIRLKINGDQARHRAIFDRMREAGIGVNLHYIPIHLQPYYQRMGFGEGDFPQAEAYYHEAMSLPLFPTLKETQQDQVVQVLQSALSI